MASTSTAAGKQLCLSFSGAGFLGIYHLGVINCLFERGKKWLSGVDSFAGASSGAMVATIMALGSERIDVLAAQEFVMTIAQDMRKKSLSAFTPGANLIGRFSEYLHAVLPDDAHTVVTGRLYLSVTNTRTRKNELISQFVSREELIDYVLASCCIPGFHGVKGISINRQRYLDGGLTTNLPVLGGQFTTVRVSPFCCRVEICPVDKKVFGPFMAINGQNLQLSRVNVSRIVQALFPPKRSELEKFYHYGYNDARRFLFIQEILDNGTNLTESDIDVKDIDFESEKRFLDELRKSQTSLNKKSD